MAFHLLDWNNLGLPRGHHVSWKCTQAESLISHTPCNRCPQWDQGLPWLPMSHCYPIWNLWNLPFDFHDFLCTPTPVNNCNDFNIHTKDALDIWTQFLDLLVSKDLGHLRLATTFHCFYLNHLFYQYLKLPASKSHKWRPKSRRHSCSSFSQKAVIFGLWYKEMWQWIEGSL